MSYGRHPGPRSSRASGPGCHNHEQGPRGVGILFVVQTPTSLGKKAANTVIVKDGTTVRFKHKRLLGLGSLLRSRFLDQGRLQLRNCRRQRAEERECWDMTVSRGKRRGKEKWGGEEKQRRACSFCEQQATPQRVDKRAPMATIPRQKFVGRLLLFKTTEPNMFGLSLGGLNGPNWCWHNAGISLDQLVNPASFVTTENQMFFICSGNVPLKELGL